MRTPTPEMKHFSSYSLLKFVYVTIQWRHSLVSGVPTSKKNPGSTPPTPPPPVLRVFEIRDIWVKINGIRNIWGEN